MHFNRTSFGGGYVICGQCCFQNMSLDVAGLAIFCLVASGLRLPSTEVDDLLKEIADLEDSDDAEQEQLHFTACSGISHWLHC